MKKICFFNSIKFWGGGEKFYFEYALGLKKKGYDVLVICSKDSEFSKRAITTKLPQINIEVNTFSYLNFFKIFNLIGILKKENIEIIIFSTSQDLKLGALAAKLSGVKYIVYRRGLAKPIKNRFITRIIFKKILTHIIANSKETKRTILENMSQFIDQEKIKVIYNGINTNYYNNIENKLINITQHKNGGIILGNAGRLTAQKGQIYLLEVAKILKKKNIKFTLFIAGSGKLKESLNDKIKKYKLEKEVILLDFVEHIEFFMNSIDIFLFSSIWEGFGYALVEAMVKSVPVVAFNITSNPEVVQNNVSGFLVDYPDIEMFSSKIELLIRDKQLREKMGEAGRKIVLDRFLFSKSLLEFEQFLF